MLMNHTLVPVPVSVPLLPDDERARQLLREELAKGIYQEAEPSLLERAWAAVLNWLAEVFGSIQSVDAGIGTILLAAGAVALILVAVLLIRPRLNARRRRDPQVFDAETGRSATGHRELAESAAGRSDWDAALTERFRAITRTAEERVILDEQPGRTAVEVADQLSNSFNPLSAELAWLASRFNEVHYGARPATQEDYLRTVNLDEQLLRTQPERGVGSPRWTVPA